MARSTITCCYNCSSRYVGCHAACEEYQAQKKAWDLEREEIKKAKEESRVDLFDRLSYWR